MFYLNSSQMYEVFFNDYLILFEMENQNSSKNNIIHHIDIECVNDFFILIKDIETGKYAEEPKIHVKVGQEIFSQLKKSLVEIPASGGLVRNNRGEILFIKRMGRWDLPKGKIEKNEKPSETALREVKEECGLSQNKILKPLPSTHHLYTSPFIPGENNLVWKETHWFEMLHSGKEEVFPQAEEQIEEVRWFPTDELDEVFSSTYKNLQKLLKNYLD